nr:RILP proteinprotein [Hymenolepis microstoma]
MLASSEWKSGFPCDAAAAAEGILEGESTSQTWDCETTEGNETDFVSVAEVYEMAAAIGKDFEALIDSHGGDSMCGLMPKVIHVLEELEEQASKRDGQLGEIAALQAAIERLEADKIARAQQRLKDEQDTLKLEENWRSETSELQTIIKALSDENAQLTEMIEAAKSSRSHRPVAATAARKTEEESLLRRLKEVVDAQTVELRSQRRILAQRSIDFDAMKLQADRLAHLNAKGPRLKFISQTEDLPGGMVAYLADKIKDLETCLQTKRVLIEEIKNHIGPSSGGCQYSNALMATSINEGSKKSDFARVINADDKLMAKSARSNGSYLASNSSSFKLEELRQLLIESMELESKIIQCQDRLEVYRRAGDDEPPVQGPINREPFEKAESWTKSTLTVKILFEKLAERIRSKTGRSSF